MDNQIHRGEIYYIHADNALGSEYAGGRPAIIVSNDTGNQCAPVVEVVYLTTQAKRPMPTHVEIQSAPRASTALCEQIHTVSKERIGDYAGRLTEDELHGVDNALRVSIGLGGQTAPAQQTDKLLITACAERDIYKTLYEGVLDKLIGGAR